MRVFSRGLLAAASMISCVWASSATADENLFGYVKGAETLPEGGWEIYQWMTIRTDKGQGDYTAVDTKTEVEYGLSDRFNLSGSIFTQSIDTSGLIVDGYLPGPEHYTLRPSRIEIGGKYNFLQPAIEPVGLSSYFSINYAWLDPHSGRDKNRLSAELEFLLQKYFLEGQMVWVGNFGLETTYADRAPIANLPAGFDWPTDPEMELELKFGTGLTYRFAPNWYLGGEILYETEFETEVGQERWSIFAGPSLHYATQDWWLTFTWFPQLTGGGETYPGQPADLHLIEKTKQEFRLKIGVNL